MKQKLSLLLVLAAPGFLTLVDSAAAQGTAFTYQGRLNSGASPANGSYDLSFALFATSAGGAAVAGPVTNAAVDVTNGLFTTTVDLGNVFSGASNWLEIAVSPSGSNTFVTLQPRQQLTPVPYAVSAENLSGTLPASHLTGTIASNQLGGAYVNSVTFSNAGGSFNGTVSGNGGGLSNLNSSALVFNSTNLYIIAWGLNQSGQTTVPTGLGNVTAVAAGNQHSLALLANGTVAAWGEGLSNNPTDSLNYGQSMVPPGLSGVTAIAAGAFHSVALLNNGTVVAWGRNDGGQTNVPGGLNNVQAISASEYHTLALKTDGTVTGWGTNTFGQLSIPPGLSNVKMISAGLTHNLALESNGTVVAWGAGLSNNPSDGIDFGQSMVPPGLSNVVAVSAGGLHSLALKADGTVVGWGAGLITNYSDNFDFGQAVPPPGLSNVVAIVADLADSLALEANGTVVAWGNVFYGPTSIPSYVDRVVALAQGSTAEHVLALRPQSDAPVAWLDGDNTFNGNVQVNGNEQANGNVQINGVLTASDGLSMGGDIRLNNGTLWLRGNGDVANGLHWDSASDGPVLFGESGGKLETINTNGTQVAVAWNNLQQVGIGTASPRVRLDLGDDIGNPKLNLGGGASIGAYGARMSFNLSGVSGGRFSFMDVPGGDELLTISDVNFGLGVGTVGIGTTVPQAKLDVRGSVKLGTNGQFYASGGIEDLYIIRGVVSSTGAILAGTGFTVSHTGTGLYTITFTNAFSAMPAVTVTPQSGAGRIATCTNVGTGSTGIDTRDTSGTATDNQFNFIAIGPK